MADDKETENTENTEEAQQEGAQESGAEQIEQVAEAAEDVSDAASAVASSMSTTSIDFIMDIPLAVTVEVGRTKMTIQDLIQMGQGSVVELEKLAGAPLDIYINGKKVAVGEAVIVNEKFGVRLLDIISPKQRLEGLAQK